MIIRGCLKAGAGVTAKGQEGTFRGLAMLYVLMLKIVTLVYIFVKDSFFHLYIKICAFYTSIKNYLSLQAKKPYLVENWFVRLKL